MTNKASDTADLVSNAFANPQFSLMLRQILQAALGSSSAAAASWAPEAQALLANVIMNDNLNWWNLSNPVDPKVVQNYITQALSSASQATQARAHLAQGLVHRANRKHPDALRRFQQAIDLDGGFARAYAQIGNQYVRLGEEKKSYPFFWMARKLAPNHPACGYFDWGEGRAYFQEEKWLEAINSLSASVKNLSTVWYNRCYLAAAQDAAGLTGVGLKTITDFVNDPQFQKTFSKIKALPQPDPSTPVGAGWKRVLEYVIPHLPKG